MPRLPGWGMGQTDFLQSPSRIPPPRSVCDLRGAASTQDYARPGKSNPEDSGGPRSAAGAEKALETPPASPLLRRASKCQTTPRNGEPGLEIGQKGRLPQLQCRKAPPKTQEYS